MKKIGFRCGFDTKLWSTKVLSEKAEGLYYQYLDKSSLAYCGIFKDVQLTDNPIRSNFIFTGSLSAGYFFGNPFKGTNTRPESKFRIIPAISLKIVKSNFSAFAGFEYINTEFYKEWPVWCRAGISYNFDLWHSRTPIKTIKWY